jgi:3-oxoadipate enol-lactonase
MARTPIKRTGKAAVNGIYLYYERVGAGPPVVLVPTESIGRGIWDAQVAPFAQRYAVVRYDPRGVGKSGFRRALYRHAADLATLLNQLDIERTTLVGFRDGTDIALELALDHPEWVQALVLVRPDLNRFWTREELAEAFDRIFEDTPATARDYYRRHPQVSRRVFRRSIPNLVRAFWRMYWPPFSDRLAPDKWPRWRDPPAIDRLGEITVPTLIVRGEHVTSFGARVAEFLQREIAGARLVIVPGSASYPHMEAPSAFNRIVLEFLASVYPAGEPGDSSHGA